MDAPFRARRRGVEVKLGSAERELLVRLLGQLDELLGDAGAPGAQPDPGSDGQRGAAVDEFALLAASTGLDAPEHVRPPDDPALARLLPAANTDDQELAAEFRRLTEQGLRARKRSGARLAAGALGRPHPLLAPPEATALLKALTDLRLVLGERLGLRTDDDADRLHAELALGTRDEQWTALAVTYDALTWWQESLVGALAKSR